MPGVNAFRDFVCQNPLCGVAWSERAEKNKPRKYCPKCRKRSNDLRNGVPVDPATIPLEEKPIPERVLELFKRNKRMSGRSLSDELKIGLTEAEHAVRDLMLKGHAIIEQHATGTFELVHDVAPGGRSALVIPDRGDGWRPIGVTSDNHLGSKHTRLDVVNDLYDRFAEEGVRICLNAGNWIEGDSRLNKHDIAIGGMTNQINFMIDNFPRREGIETYLVSGDDHEGWYTQRENINIGRFLQSEAEAQGRHDLKHLGYVEADIDLLCGDHVAILKLMHGGGGVPYALSYALQKMVESFQGGEKPAVLVMGHHHKFDYCFPRNVHALMPGCTQDQSIFMRKKRIEAHVGGCILWIKQDPETGAITRFRCEWLHYFDRGYYSRRFE